MKVQDAISAYDFLAKLDWTGVIGLTIALTLVIVFFALSITDKLSDDKKIKQRMAVTTAISVIICMCILKIDADNNYDLLSRANDIKQYMLRNNESSSGFKELADYVDFPDSKSFEERREEINNIVKHFPDEFAPTSIEYPDVPDDTDGITLTNRKTLQLFDDQNGKLYPLYKGEILNFMKLKQWDTLNYKYIREILDNRCSDNILDMLISENSKLFIHIYSPHNIYDKNDKKNDEGGTDALKINSDSVTQILAKKTGI
jgi:hypothetical protein